MEANARNIPSIIDPKRRNFHFYHHTTLFKPNLRELRDGFGLELSKPLSIDKLNEAAEIIFEKMNVRIAFFTLSDEGVYINNRKEKLIVPSHKRNIYDVSGAGDTVASVAALGLASGLEPAMIAELTNIAGGLVCEEVGVVPIEKEKFFVECIRLLGA
jgi:bifunctional ADP-heptose synthase (sugar kinase/adenylyltransferase)